MLNLDDFCVQLPKVELHAHLNGSLSVDTMRELVELKKDMNPELAQFKIPDSLDSIHDFFPIFRFIYQLTDTEESVAIATRNIINEFKADGVRYLELRTTPRKNNETNMTKHTYINTIVNVMQEEREDIIVRLIISVDRSNTLAEAEEVVDLALMFKEKGVVGIDLCGNVSVGLFETLKPAFERAKKHGFSITLHFNEIKENLIEAPSLLSIHPSRLGHATVLDDVSRRFIYENNIPIEVCMTSNIICKTVDKYEEHHLKDLLEHQHPFALCVSTKLCKISTLLIYFIVL
ncbi:hypothetical protein BDB01DRAFT_717643 [Pilobolus umbonatus]|nr:hypothetical protein BDB01DRAFT_717643 [Pilobolus umbonatus]